VIEPRATVSPHDDEVNTLLVYVRQDFFVRNPAIDSGDGLDSRFGSALCDGYDSLFSLFGQLVFDREPFRLWECAIVSRIEDVEG